MPPAPPKPAAPTVQVWWTVRKGDTLSKLSKRWDVINALLGRNRGQGPGNGKLTNPDVLQIGQRIRIK